MEAVSRPLLAPTMLCTQPRVRWARVWLGAAPVRRHQQALAQPRICNTTLACLREHFNPAILFTGDRRKHHWDSVITSASSLGCHTTVPLPLTFVINLPSSYPTSCPGKKILSCTQSFLMLETDWISGVWAILRKARTRRKSFRNQEVNALSVLSEVYHLLREFASIIDILKRLLM